MTKHCMFYWGGEPAEGGGSFSLQAGIAPSSGLMRFTLGQSVRINQINTFTLTDFDTVQTRFNRCRVTRATIGQSSGGARWYEVQFQDRRWMWGERCFALYGEYNTNLDGATSPIQSGFARTTRQLAVLCLEAMGEVGYDISLLPDFPGPPVVWDASDPAVELQQICGDLGCIVTLSAKDRVVIARDGFGRVPSPDSRQMDFTASTEPPIIPAALVFEGGRMHIQHDLVLQPVAYEYDRTSPNYGKYVSIYSVSYYLKLRAAGGNWKFEDPNNFAGLVTAINNADGAAAAAEAYNSALLNVWRKYAVLGPIQLPVPPDDVTNRTNGKALTATQVKQLKSYFKINSGEGWRMLPWNEKMNISSSLGSDAEIYGYRWLGQANNKNTNGVDELSDLPSTYTNPDVNLVPLSGLGANSVHALIIPKTEYSIDFKTGLVTFNKATLFYDLTELRQPAVIRLRTSFPLRDRDTGVHTCPQWWRVPGSPVATDLAKMVKRSDSFLEFDSENHNNVATFKSDADYWLAAELNSYSIGNGYSAPYKGFVVDIPIDGVVRTIAWDFTPESGGITHIDYNMERPEMYLTLAEIHARRMATWNAFKAADDERKARRLKQQGL